jgi:hypothetical protein
MKMRALLVAAAMAVSSPAWAQPFNEFVGGLPMASAPSSVDNFYLLQSGISKQLAGSTFFGGAYSWSGLQTFSAGVATSQFNGVPANTDPFTITANLFGEFRFEDNGSEGASFATIYNSGSGYGNTLTGTMSPSTGCTVPPIISVTTNSGGQIATINNGGVPTTVGVCGNGTSFPNETTTWVVVSGLSAGTGAAFLLTPMVFSGVGAHCASDSTRFISTDLTRDVSARFYMQCSGSLVWPLINASLVPVSAGLVALNAAIELNGAIMTAAAPTVGAAQIGYGSTTVSAGTGTCPSGTVGGQTVLGCIVINIAGTARNVPFF